MYDFEFLQILLSVMITMKTRHSSQNTSCINLFLIKVGNYIKYEFKSAAFNGTPKILSAHFTIHIAGIRSEINCETWQYYNVVKGNKITYWQEIQHRLTVNLVIIYRPSTNTSKKLLFYCLVNDYCLEILALKIIWIKIIAFFAIACKLCPSKAAKKGK